MIKELLGFADIGFCHVELDGKIITINESAMRILELDDSAGPGNLIPDLIGEYQNVFDGGNLLKTEKGVELHLETAKGNKKWVRHDFFVSTESNDTGSGETVCFLLRDITENVKLKQDLQLARNLEAIGFLAGGIAHDYNNALTAVIGNISLAKMDIDPGNASLLEILSDAETASFRIRKLTQQLAAFAKGGRPVKKPVLMGGILKNITDLLFRSYAGVCSLDIEEGLGKIEIDEKQVSYALEHIINNAKETKPDGDGEIWIQAKNVSVVEEETHHEMELRAGDYVLISIRDEGNGIAAEDKYAIFEPYYTTKEGYIGMGLAISYAIIKRHHGYIDVESETGKGATFLLYFPVIAQADYKISR
ncbi:MAG: hypothetical protein GY754_06895 [bacterium]|nr:hypothetical protein [bacterium]